LHRQVVAIVRYFATVTLSISPIAGGPKP